MTGLPLPWRDLGATAQDPSAARAGHSGTPPEARRTTTTAALVEQAAAVGVAALRLSLVVQMVPAVVSGTHLSPHPRWYVAMWTVAVVVVLVGAVAALVRRRPLPAPAVYVDVAIAVVLLVLSSTAVPVEDRTGSWVGWTAGYALTIACTSGTLRSTRAWLSCLGAVVTGYVVYAGPLADGPELPSVVANTLGYVVLAGTVRLIIWYLRRISGIADDARAEVARLARLEEEHRAQLAMHDATTVMQLLADPTLPTGLRAQLQSQAVGEVRRMRSYLRGEPGRDLPLDGADDTRLRSVVDEACEGFADLGVEVSTDLLDEVAVERDCATDLVAALRTVLHNVRRHARASRVVVHGDASPPGLDGVRRWTICVSDDGCGFEVATTPLGVGLRSQVVDQLALHEVAAAIRSSPGRGTRVELTGSAAA
ncbi:Signal transduction histidine kinase [Microlunatus sagamiharensis]|uniref:histidine kinase n=1 Tax=Microlunatus sagamiharensis TaxID=546874 RepID=A0A1H2MKG4_9ACTN|nr:hypothetical protein [Microlunatus sagamiharensis]SDU93689.1 Signal transduction histidine kinase [Microlunatus sagamiharensis]